jgi:DNA-binding GntR family transcriptional regulator
MDRATKKTFSPDEIYSFIRFKIVAGEYPSGSRINVKKLSENFGISRIPIRDVINRLCGEGLVQKGSNDRFLVAPLTELDIRETYELRGILEGYLAKQAATNFREEDLGLLEENLKQQEIERGSIEKYIQLNTEFHEYFFKATPNSKFINFLRRIRDYQYRFDRINWITHGSFFVNLTLDQHREILDAIKKRNGELAEKIIKLHMNTGVEFLVKALKEKKLLP